MYGHNLAYTTPSGRRKCSKCGYSVVTATANGRSILTTWYRGSKMMGTNLPCPGKDGHGPWFTPKGKNRAEKCKKCGLLRIKNSFTKAAGQSILYVYKRGTAYLGVEEPPCARVTSVKSNSEAALAAAIEAVDMYATNCTDDGTKPADELAGLIMTELLALGYIIIRKAPKP